MGHSAGGLSVTLATLKFPKKIRLAVYVAATMLKHGFSSDEDIKDVMSFFKLLLPFHLFLFYFNCFIYPCMATLN